jgi:ATP-binding cassette subfamily B multidrug efflux pump
VGKHLIISFLKKHRFTYIVGILFMLSTSFIQSLFPRVLGNTIDILKVDDFELSLVNLHIIYILLITVGAFIGTYMWRNLVIANARNLECFLREMLYDHFQKLSPEFYNRRKTGDLIAYAMNDISAVRLTFGPATARTVNGIVICIVSIYAMSRIANWTLTLIALLPVPVVVVFMLDIGKLVQKRFRKVQENFAAISDRVQENIYGIRVIKSFVQEDAEVENFEVLSDKMLESNIDMIRTSSLLSPIIEFCFSISFVANLIIGGNLILAGRMSLGDFIAFNGYLTMIRTPIISIGRVVTMFQRGMASFKRLNEIFDVKPQIKDGEKMICSPIEGEIHIRNLSFTYPGTQTKVLDSISIHIPKGATLGIIGKSGSGKSTIANLLLKLYNVEPGTIFIDGIDVNDYELKTLREGFGYAPQDNFLFSASIKDNIAFFRKTYSDSNITRAAQDSCIYESILDLDDGFDTLLGERGVNLSGGQKQRISISRAIIREPAILILDDSLSAVDTITEGRILNNFARVRKDRTTIVIAHRITAVKNADEIVVLDDGQICEQGTYDDLLKKRGAFYEICMEQVNQAY